MAKTTHYFCDACGKEIVLGFKGEQTANLSLDYIDNGGKYGIKDGLLCQDCTNKVIDKLMECGLKITKIF